MKVSRDFLKDFAYIANLYGWNAADIEDVKAQTRAHPETLRRYWTTLAAAHRAGYQQTEANGHERLQAWIDRTPSFSEQYAHAHESISARIARAREVISADFARAREAQHQIIISHRTQK